jgi:hypothetical protein
MSGGFSPSGAYGNPLNLNSAAGDGGGTQLTLTSTANLMCGWTPIGTLARDCVALLVYSSYFQFTLADNGLALDVGIGISGNQQTIVSKINQSAVIVGDFDDIRGMLFPITLPAGTQVWARAALNASTTPTSTCYVSMRAFDNDFLGNPECACVDTIGATGVGAGSVITGGADAKGAWVQLTASTVRDYAGFLLGFDCANQNNTILIFAQIDIAIGSPQQIISADTIVTLNSQNFCDAFIEYCDVEIPAGSAIYARSANIDSSTTNVGVTLYGIYK